MVKNMKKANLVGVVLLCFLIVSTVIAVVDRKINPKEDNSIQIERSQQHIEAMSHICLWL